MQTKFNEQKLQESLKASLFCSEKNNFPEFGPNLIHNDYKKYRKVLTSLVDELDTCESFDFSVAFITSDGLACLINKFHELQKNNIRGRILTTNYLTFTDPKALEKLLLFPNIELRVFTESAFHPKGYIFRQSNYYSIIIGSANLTQNALSRNQEWNLRVISCSNGELVFSARQEFERLWAKAEVVTPEWIAEYEILYKNHKQKSKVIPVDSIEDTTEQEALLLSKQITANTMQQDALINLQNLREKGENRAIIIAATGTGKTYLAAFDVRQTNPKKMLYIVHRETILKKSEESFKLILGSDIKSGFLTGSVDEKNYMAPYLFASVYTLAKDETLQLYKPNEFDYIIIDEVHHSGAATYKKLINYFHPKFLLGLTATPERTDGFDIFQFFNYNIASEIRLKQALEADLLCPFHYYGITDLTIDDEVIDDTSKFEKLTTKERVRHIKDAIVLYRNNSEPNRGLIFCSRNDEAQKLSELMNAEGFTTIALSGNSSDDEREAAISRLENNDDPLEYIISVDILNEGVDIPSVNQILMLRPTKSAIIFIQQLGRGLRKNQGKSYLTVIDFIGNYTNNFMIPIALYGDNSLNKDTLRRCINSGSSSIPGASTIDLDLIAKQKIYQAISNTKFEKLSLLKNEYDKIKARIGKIPQIMDFVGNDAVDPILFIQYANSYYEFCCKMEKVEPKISKKHMQSLEFISLELAKGIRLHEIVILQLALNDAEFSIEQIVQMLEKYNIQIRDADIKSAINVINGTFYTDATQNKYGNMTYLNFNKNKFLRTQEFSSLLENATYRQQLEQTLRYAFYSWQRYYSDNPDEYNLVLYSKYSRKDICRLLDWDSDVSSTIYGYKTMHSRHPYTCPIFVTYEKALEKNSSTNYDDHFIDNNLFNWMTRNKRTSNSEEVAIILDQENNGIKIPLFVKKDDAEGYDFYYMGDCLLYQFDDTKMPDGDKMVPVVNIMFTMKTPVREDMLRYLNESSEY
jgi:superfamily II DNA or RNA helicase/HKD family nuclease